MIRQIVLLPEAEADLQSAKDFYASSESRLGDYCLDCLLSDIDRLAFFLCRSSRSGFWLLQNAGQAFPVFGLLPHHRRSGCGCRCS